MLQKQAYVALQLLAHLERVAQTLGQHLLFGRKFQRIVGVYRWELVAGELVLLSIERDNTSCIVDVAQHGAVCHLPMGMLFKELCLHFELYYGNGLVHKCRKPHGLFIEFH